MRIVVAAAVWTAAIAVYAQSDLPQDLLLLTRAKRHMAAVLAEVPNYTCLETVQRLHRSKPSAPWKRQDTVRFEVAHVNGSELFAAPGASAFEEDTPAALVGGGMIGSGMFASFARSVFLGNQTTFQYRGEEDLNGRRLLRYDYRIGPLFSDWQVQVAGASGNVSTRGAIWLDRNNLDLVRLEADGEDIPPTIPLDELRATVDYARSGVGDGRALLPQSGELLMRQVGGSESLNRSEFTHCRAYQAESSLSFGPVPPQSEGPLLGAMRKAEPSTEPAALAAGLVLQLSLTAPVDSASAESGSAIEARVESDVRFKGAVLVPEGTVVRGRLRRLDFNSDPQPFWVVGLEFDELVRPAGRARFFAELVRVEHPPAGLKWLMGFSHESSYTLPDGTRVISSETEKITVDDLPGVGTFFMEGRHFVLPAGMRMVWKTRTLQ
jgi:hypothetical protein